MRLFTFSIFILLLSAGNFRGEHNSKLSAGSFGQTHNSKLYKDSLFDMCSVMPGDEVASLSPFGTPIKLVTADDRLDGYCGCHYDFEWKSDYPQAYIAVNQFGSLAECKEAFAMNRQDWVSFYQRQPDYINNFADSAAWFGNAQPDKCSDCGLRVVSGRFLISVAFNGVYDDISADAKKNSALAMVRRLFEKKPFLRDRSR
jgi:hypothetical protein